MIATAVDQSADEFVTASTCDRHVQAAVAGALAGSKYMSIRRLNCKVCDGVVEISGTVSSFYLKQLAQVAVLQVDSSAQVRNLVEVRDEGGLFVASDCVANHPRNAA